MAIKDGQAEYGWLGIDGIEVLESGDGTCETLPKEAQITTIPPETTTPANQDQFPECDFEGDATCGWTSNKDHDKG